MKEVSIGRRYLYLIVEDPLSRRMDMHYHASPYSKILLIFLIAFGESYADS